MRRSTPLVLGMLAAVLLTAWPIPADAQGRHRVYRPYGYYPRSSFYIGGYFGPYFYFPWWYSAGPYWGYPAYPYYYAGPAGASVRIQVEPKTAEVYVDGYFAGVVDQFDGFFQSLNLAPGAHDITVYLEGYRTMTQRLYLSQGSTYKLRHTLEKLPPGEPNEPRPLPPPEPPPSQGLPAPAPAPSERASPTEPAVASPSGFGQVAIRVQPADATVSIDGEPWHTSPGADRLVVHLAAGTHRLEITREGYISFVSAVVVNPGETAVLNVSLSERR